MKQGTTSKHLEHIFRILFDVVIAIGGVGIVLALVYGVLQFWFDKS